jgi:hypothetical protein
MSLLADTYVYIGILVAVLIVVAGVIYAVGHLAKHDPEASHTRADHAYEAAGGRSRQTA